MWWRRRRGASPSRRSEADPVGRQRYGPAIYVHDGDHVRKGQALLDLDPTLSGADLAQTQKSLLTAETDVARNQTIADALAGAFVAPVI